MNKPLILVTNDDGITSKGIAALVSVVKEIGEVVVLAPDSPNSGMGHAITVDSTIHIKKSNIFGEGVEAYECSGTPADCVKLAKHQLLKDRTINLVVSGINHGHNASISVIYSGTMAAAREGSIEGIPAIGFSIDDFRYDADFEHTLPFIQKICETTISNGLPAHRALNVNFPKASKEPIKGIKVVRQTNGYWKEEFDARTDPHGRPYFWMGGEFINHEPGNEETDMWCLDNNYASVVPCQTDLTDYESIEKLSEWDLKVK
ncbi:5'/3'-nucleotidase SurE [Jiulongibacter sp. NS-SX5]|uniref:5'/3'-nucleotidase SurE n=1 Tax=Jiulongibacter sp. NS-SX5 TaxID=3463854 RepID=UPI004058A7C5